MQNLKYFLVCEEIKELQKEPETSAVINITPDMLSTNNRSNFPAYGGGQEHIERLLVFAGEEEKQVLFTTSSTVRFELFPLIWEVY